MEAGESVVWHSVNDHRQYLCYGGSNYCGSADRIVDGSVYGKILSEKAVQDPETGSRTSGGNSIGSIWILWADGAGTVCA